MSTPAPHILVLNVFFAPFSYGGATIVAEAVAQQLIHRHGCRVSAISVMSRGDLAPYSVLRAEANGVVNHLINLPRTRSYRDVYDNPAVTARVAEIAAGLAPDLVHAHCLQDLGAGLIPALAGQGLPVVLSVHDFWWLCERQFMIREDQTYCAQDPVRIEGCRGCADDLEAARTRLDHLHAAAAAANLITYPSAFARDLSQRSGLRGAGKGNGDGDGVVWPNGVRLPAPEFFTAQAARRAADPRLAFGFVGGPSQIKGWPLIRNAFETLGRDDFTGHLVEGSLDGTWWPGERLGGLRGDWQVHPRFEQDQMDAFYARIDVLLFLSQWKETFGLSVREALARGIRVIQTDSGGTIEHAAANPADLLAIGDGPEVLRTQLHRVLDTPHAHPAPLDVAGFADQADMFMDMVRPLLAR